MSLERGDIVRTGDDSWAQITFFDGTTVDLEAGTEIEIVLLAGSADTASTTIRLKQAIGSIIFRVYRIIDPESSYEVETPAAVVAVRGSAMRVDVIEDGTTLITNLAGDIWASAQGVELQIPEGRQCIIRPEEPPELISEVTFLDPNLEAAIREAIGKPTGDIYPSDLEGLTLLDAHGRDIIELTGLEYCANLSRLHLDSNKVSDISPLAGLTNLTSLGLGNNLISDISPLSNLTSLTELFLSDNQISDVLALSNLTSLKSLPLYNNEIVDISPLSGLTSLSWLGLGGNQISDISPLSNLISLTLLHLWDNQMSDISVLAGLTNLTSLSLCSNEISDISPLSNLTDLTSLLLQSTQVSDVSPLAGLTKLTYLGLTANQISDVSPLVNLTSLEWLSLGLNGISDISPLAGLTNLTWLSLFDNQISDIKPLVDNPGMGEGDEVWLEGNPLSEQSINEYIPALQARGVDVRY